MKAVARIARDSWYTGNVHIGQAPYCVFFEGWDSTPRGTIIPWARPRTRKRDGIKEYIWDFGDGSPKASGFAVSHCYTNVGVFTATLTVRGYDGTEDTTSLDITITLPKNPPYFVDGELGNDSNDGLTPVTAWKTLTKVRSMLLAGAINSQYVYLKRGSMYDLVPDLRPKGSQICFLSYGDGPSPVIRRSGTNNISLFNSTHGDFSRVTFLDIIFDSKSAEGVTGNIWDQKGRCFNVAFINCTFLNAAQSVTVNRPGFESFALNSASCVFFDGCTFRDSTSLHIFFRGKYLAMTNCIIEKSGNHGAYVSWVQGGVFHNNTFQEISPARTCLRVSGAANQNNWDYPSKNVSIRGNRFNGQVSHEFVVEIAPNTKTFPQKITNVEFIGNTVYEGRTLLAISSTEDLLVEGNTLISDTDDGTYSSRINLSPRFNTCSLKNIHILNNTIRSNTKRKSSVGRTIGIFPGVDGSLHENIVIEDNTITMLNGTEYGLFFAVPIEQLPLIHTQNDWLQVDRCENKTVCVGSNEYTFNSWFEYTGNEVPPPSDTDLVRVELELTRGQLKKLILELEKGL